MFLGREVKQAIWAAPRWNAPHDAWTIGGVTPGPCVKSQEIQIHIDLSSSVVNDAGSLKAERDLGSCVPPEAKLGRRDSNARGRDTRLIADAVEHPQTSLGVAPNFCTTQVEHAQT
jgi:hypothetical protein